MSEPKKPNILFYDIETFPLGFDGFRTGQQYMNHKQLQDGRDVYDIITIQYLWADSETPVNLTWVGKKTSSASIVEAFDEQVRKADIIIGKNSDSFDSRHINTQRMLQNLEPFPDWGLPRTRDDLQNQMRKHFYLASYSLDYFCKILFNSGKDSMEFPDWTKIRNYKEICELEMAGCLDLNPVCTILYKKTLREIKREGKESLKKMAQYGVKDVVDTKLAWERALPYIKPKLNMSTFLGHQDGKYGKCRNCGGEKIVKNGPDLRGAVKKQKFWCKDCNTTAGTATILTDGKFGKIS